MDLTTKNRTQLKQSFLNNKVPTEDDFAALIDAGINQVDDRIARPAGQPLSIAAEGTASGNRPLLRFYGTLTDRAPIWAIEQRAATAGTPGGMNFLSGGATSSLFLADDGRIGICTDTPAARLDIHSPDDAAVSIRRETWDTGKHWQLNTEGGSGSETLSFAWNNVNARALIIKPDGRVGITEYDPRERLDVGRAGGPKGGIAVGDYLRLGETQLNNIAFMSINAWLSSSDITGANAGIKFQPAWKGDGTHEGKGMVIAQNGGGGGDIDYWGVNWKNSDAPKNLHTDFTHVATFTHDGRFGLSTRTPQTTFEMKGTLRVGSNASNDNPYGSFNIHKVEAAVNYAGLGFNNGSALNDNVEDALNITRQGRVGIGNNQPVAQLDVWPANDFALSLRRQSWVSGRDWKINVEGGNGSEWLAFAWSGVTDRKLIIRSNGNIGMGTTNMPFTLNVGSANGASQLLLAANNTLRGKDTLNLIRFGTDGDYQILHKSAGALGRNTLGIHAATADAIGFYSSGWTPLFEVAGGTGDAYFKGSVGIGQPPNAYKLSTAAGVGAQHLQIAATTSLLGNTVGGLIKFGNSGDYQFCHNANGVFNRNTLGLHMAAGDSFGLYSSGWKPLFAVAGDTGHTWFRERIGVAGLPEYPLDIHNAGSGSWGRFCVTGTDLWSKGAGPYVTIGAGAAAGIMFNNPHVTWVASEARASMRYGCINANTSPGGWWDVGARANAAFTFAWQNGVAQMSIMNNGNVGIGLPTPESKLHVSGRVDVHGNQARFNGIHAEARRAQLVLSSEYSDLVIASSQINNNHGSTLTFATYNPGNAGDYRKWVVNQGNWGSRMHMLDFGYSAANGRANPHENSNGTDSLMVLDGVQKLVGIGSMNPSAQLSLGEWNYGPAGRSGDGATQLLLSGTHNVGVNQGSAGGTYKLKIEGYDNDGQVVYPIYVMDENKNEDFYLKNRPSAGGVSTIYCGGIIQAGNSDLYFTKTDHNHSGLGNATNNAAIENAANYNCLMILGRTTTSGRRIGVWDYFQVNGTFVNSSDRRLKKDISSLAYGLKEVLKLKPVTFNWKDKFNPHKTMGLVAQDVEEVVKEAVFDDDSTANAHKSVGYTTLIPVLINAIKELNKKVEDLEAQVARA